MMRLSAKASVVLGVVPWLLFSGPTRVYADWPQWGGPNRNFTVETSGLADTWPEDGPPRLWHRELGDGYSAIVAADGVLYTMYRPTSNDQTEITVALAARTGRTLWEHENAAPNCRTDDSGWGGEGPNATPLIVGDRLYSVGSNAVLLCLDRATGKALWKHDLTAEFGAPFANGTYSASAIAYGNLVIASVGRDRDTPATGYGLVAFDQSTGAVAWKGPDYSNRFSSPILINLDGEAQLVLTTDQGMVGVDPQGGRLLWRHPTPGNIVTPVWNGDDLIFYSSGGDDGTGLAVKLTRTGDTTTAQERWKEAKVRIWQPTPVLLGDHLYGSTNTLLLAVNVHTGKRAWVKRGFPMATCVAGDGKLIILDEEGQLTLATATPEALIVHAQHTITERYSFSVPTLVGTTLYVRDRKHIMALDLGEPRAGTKD